MSKIIFLNDPITVYDASFTQIGKNQIRLIFENDKPNNDTLLSGLHIINEYNGFVMTEREDYKYIYRIYNDNPLVIELCNDGIKYVEPEPIVIPEPEPYIPTYEEVLENKINELSIICQNTITST